MQSFYQNFPLETDPGRLRISVSAPRDKLQAYFSRAAFSSVPPFTHSRLLQVCYELTDNAFVHGKATTVDIAFDGRRLVVRDNGVSFNPLDNLDHRKISVHDHIGSLVLHIFCFVFAENANFGYDHDHGLNSITVDFGDSLPSHIADGADLHIDTATMFGRRGAEQYGDSLPIYPGVKGISADIHR